MTDSSLTPTAEELAAIKLVYEFQKAVQGRVQSFKEEMARRQEQIVSAATQRVEAMNDADLDAAVIRTLVDANPPLTEDEAKEQLAQFDRDAKVGFVGQYMLAPQLAPAVEAMDEADLHAKCLELLKKEGFSEDEAQAELAASDRDTRMDYALSNIAIEQALAMSEADLDDAAVKGLMMMNPGVDEAGAAQQAASASREEKNNFLIGQLAQAEMAKLPAPENPAQALIREMNIDPEETNAKVGAFVEKYGQKALMAELQRLHAASNPAPKP